MQTDSDSQGKCSECKATFNNVIMERGKAIKIKKCQKCFDRSSKCSKCQGIGHRPRNCVKTSKTNTHNQESGKDEVSDESENNVRYSTSDMSTSFLRTISDKVYAKDLRKSNNGMRWVKHVKGRNTIMSNLEWLRNEFLEGQPTTT